MPPDRSALYSTWEPCRTLECCGKAANCCPLHSHTPKRPNITAPALRANSTKPLAYVADENARWRHPSTEFQTAVLIQSALRRTIEML
jgi:hypothetical protein